jgi:hypothetical protein
MLLAAILSTSAVVLIAVIGGVWWLGLHLGGLLAEVADIRYRLGTIERALGVRGAPIRTPGAGRRRAR